MQYAGFALVLLISCLHSAYSLKCWACSSDLDPSCLDNFNATKILQQRSYYRGSNYNAQYQRNDIPDLIECSNNLGQLYGQKQVCVKRILKGPNGMRHVSRECKAISDREPIGTCLERNNNLEFCEYCEYDGCNGATNIKMNLFLSMALFAVVNVVCRSMSH